MTNREYKDQMLDYVVRNLSNGGHDVRIRRQDLLCKMNPAMKGESTYLLVDADTPEKGLVLLVDRVYTGAKFDILTSGIRKSWSNSAVLFLKDGETYFRNSASRHDYKRRKDLSLKEYTADETHKMIMLSPAEIKEMMRNRKRNGTMDLQYYQPKSERLEEAIVTYRFDTVEYDYSHVPSYRFQVRNRESERIFIWKEKLERTGQIKLHNGRIICASTQPQTGSQGAESPSPKVPA